MIPRVVTYLCIYWRRSHSETEVGKLEQRLVEFGKRSGLFQNIELKSLGGQWVIHSN